MLKSYRFKCIASIILLMVVVLSGCVTLKGKPDGLEEQLKPITYEVNKYYVNSEYVETGDESLPKLINMPSTIEVEIKQNPYLVLMDSLKTVPEEGLATMISDQIEFNDIYMSSEEDGTIVVDLKKEGFTGGSLGEGLFIGQIVETILSNDVLTEAKADPPEQVQFLIDGEIVESLMGHIDATEPFRGGLW